MWSMHIFFSETRGVVEKFQVSALNVSLITAGTNVYTVVSKSNSSSSGGGGSAATTTPASSAAAAPATSGGGCGELIITWCWCRKECWLCPMTSSLTDMSVAEFFSVPDDACRCQETDSPLWKVPVPFRESVPCLESVP